MQAFLRVLLLRVNTHWNAKILRIQRRTVSDYLNHTATNHRLGLVFKENRNLSTSSTTLGTKKEFKPRSQRRPARKLLFWRIKWIMIAQKTIKPCSSACHRNKSLPRKRNSFVLLHCDQDWWARTLGCGAGCAAQRSYTTSFLKKSEEMKKPCLYAASIIYTVVLYPPTLLRNPPLSVAAAAPQTPDIWRYASPWRFTRSSCHLWLFKSESIPAKPCRHPNPCWFARCCCPQWKLNPSLFPAHVPSQSEVQMLRFL